MAYSDDAETKIKEHSKDILIYNPAQQENIEEQKICSAARPNVRVGRAVKEAKPSIVSVWEALEGYVVKMPMRLIILRTQAPCI